MSRRCSREGKSNLIRDKAAANNKKPPSNGNKNAQMMRRQGKSHKKQGKGGEREQENGSNGKGVHMQSKTQSQPSDTGTANKVKE